MRLQGRTIQRGVWHRPVAVTPAPPVTPEPEEITVADEAARYALTGISPGQLVTQTVGPSSVLVSDAGNSDANGEYTPRGQYMGATYFNKVGYTDDPFSYSVYNEGGTWYLNTGGGVLYVAEGTLYPWGGEWSTINGDDGPVDPPAPVVTEVPRANVVYRLLAPSTAQGGVAVLGGSQDGIYVHYEEDGFSAKQLYKLLGSSGTLDNGNFEGLYWNASFGVGAAWILTESTGSLLYYSLSDVATPDLATDWKDAYDDSPAGITVTSVTEGELNAAVTVAGAGTSDANQNFVSLMNQDGYRYYQGGGEEILPKAPGWSLSGYYQAAQTAFPWQSSWYVQGGELPAPTVTRNDIAAPANWEEV